MVERTRKEVNKGYAQFISNYEDNLNFASDLLNKKLDYSIEEVRSMFDIYRNFVISPDQFPDIAKEDILEVFTTYMGEAWMHYFGGKWHYSNTKSDSSYGHPQIIEWGPDGYFWTGISPAIWAKRIEMNPDAEIIGAFERKLKRFNKSFLSGNSKNDSK